MVLTQLLVELLINGNREAQERAVKALNALVKENTSAHEVIAQAGNPAQLVALLLHRMLRVQSLEQLLCHFLLRVVLNYYPAMLLPLQSFHIAPQMQRLGKLRALYLLWVLHP